MSSSPVTVRFVHAIRPVPHPMPRFPDGMSIERLYRAFPVVFDALTVSMFISEQGYIGYEDDERDTTLEPGDWYGLSWGCIHRDTLPVWREPAREIRKKFIGRLWRFVASFGRSPLPSRDLVMLALLAFLDPVPIGAFEAAISRLIERGMLVYGPEPHESGEVYMYYPTPLLAKTLEASRADRN